MIPGSAISKNRAGSLAPINERDEVIRSADPTVSKSRAMAAAAAHLPPKHKASGYNGGRLEANSRLVHNRHPDVGIHRSPVLPSGKENIMLPPIDTGRGGRGIHVSASRQDPISNLRNNGAAIMGGGAA